MDLGIKQALVVRGIRKAFGGVNAINDVSLSLDGGKSRMLIGPNGAGKTTLFNLISGEIRQDSGEIYMFGMNVSDSSVQRRSELGLARTYQICNLFKELTVEENVFLSLKAKDWNEPGSYLSFMTSWQRNKKRVARAREVARSVALEDKLGTCVSNLSQGEQRQLELAMALAPEPRIILFDEPMAGLSTAERVFIGALVSRLARERIVLAIEHDMDFALSITDHVTVLDHGTVVAEGSPAEIKANREVKRIYKLE
jgi:branched-chain amino acid transport system ATP-binding protein